MAQQATITKAEAEYPQASLVESEEGNRESSVPLVTAVPLTTLDNGISLRRQHQTQEAPVVPPLPSEERYRRDDQGPRMMAEYSGRQAAHQERQQVARENGMKVYAYNNQIDMNLDRGNQAAQYENRNEQWGITPKISDPPPKPKQKEVEKPKDMGYFKNPTGGYEVKEYEVKEYDTSCYEMSEYKSVYDP